MCSYISSAYGRYADFFYAKEAIMPFIQRYSDVKIGAIVFIGNTLGLSKIANAFNLGSKP